MASTSAPPLSQQAELSFDFVFEWSGQSGDGGHFSPAVAGVGFIAEFLRVLESASTAPSGGVTADLHLISVDDCCLRLRVAASAELQSELYGLVPALSDPKRRQELTRWQLQLCKQLNGFAHRYGVLQQQLLVSNQQHQVVNRATIVAIPCPPPAEVKGGAAIIGELVGVLLNKKSAKLTIRTDAWGLVPVYVEKAQGRGLGRLLGQRLRVYGEGFWREDELRLVKVQNARIEELPPVVPLTPELFTRVCTAWADEDLVAQLNDDRGNFDD